MKDLIDPANGIGMNLFRLCIGTSDFSDGTPVAGDPTNNPGGWYTYQDGGPDSAFSIQHDLDLNIVHVIKLAQDVAAKANRPIRFFASAWSPPAWMKDSNSLVGGSLLTSMIPAYAAYLRQFVQAYQAQGIPIYAITTGNEHYTRPPSIPAAPSPLSRRQPWSKRSRRSSLSTASPPRCGSSIITIITMM